MRLRLICIFLFAGTVCISGGALAVRDATEPEEGSGVKSVQSYLKNYRVVSTDLEMAAYYAKYSEDVRKLVAQYLGNPGAATVKTFITIRPDATAKSEIELWRVSILHGISSKNTGPFLKNRVQRVVTYYVTYYYLMDIASSGVSIRGSRVEEDSIPLWLCAGILENLTREDRETHRQFMVASLKEGRYIPLEELFRHDGRFPGERERAAYFHECGSLLDYLVSIEDGKEKVVDALRSLWQHDDAVIATLWQFKGEFKSIEQLEEKWLEYTKSRPEKFFDFQRYTAKETWERLDAVLAVELVTLDEHTIQEQVVETDLEGLMDHDNKPTRVSIAMKKVAELYDLKLRAPQEYQNVIGEYILALESIARDKKRDFKKHYKKANKLLAGLEVQ